MIREAEASQLFSLSTLCFFAHLRSMYKTPLFPTTTRHTYHGSRSNARALSVKSE